MSRDRAVRFATVLLLPVAALIAGAALSHAGVPPGNNSIIPPYISIVGNRFGVPDPYGTFTVLVRDLANNPVPGSMVVVDYANVPDLDLCADQQDANLVVDCATRTARKLTDAQGIATFLLMGGAHNNGGAPGAGPNALRFYADGVLLGSATVAIYDQNGHNGLGANDLSAWLADFVTLAYFGRSDYDNSGNLGANDLSLWIGLWGSGGSKQNCATFCP